MEYIILYHEDPLYLVDHVNDKIQEGFVPQGGLCCQCWQEGQCFYQAMIKTSKAIQKSA